MAVGAAFFFSLFIVPLLTSAVLSPRQDIEDGAIVYERFHIDSTIVARYATTRITSVAQNSASTSKELSFQVQLPDTAFISNFSMVVNGTTYVGVAEEKERAEQEFEERQQGGENVGLVESRGTNVFGIRINTAAASRSTFILEYEELLERRLSKYQQIINLNPGNLVQDFRATIRAIDEQGIVYFSASDFVTTSRVSTNEVMYSYAPSIVDQNDMDFGLARDMMVEFDVNHPEDGAGLIIVNECYFAHFFSPSGVDPIPVDIVFVIDVSGSMSGRKIQQASQSLVEVITQLRGEDRFSIVTFSSSTSIWMNRLVSVSEYRQSGIEFAQRLTAGGGTNFAGGMQDGINILKSHGDANYIQLLVMLTDGEPTSGITDEDEIVGLANSALVETRISLNALGFGANLNYQLLVRLALSNRGIAQRIYEGEDAADQLEGFYEEISSPILRSIDISYPPNTVEVVSDLSFPLLFDGSEIVVAGKFLDSVCLSNSGSIPVTVSGIGVTEMRSFQGMVNPGGSTEISGVVPSTERLLAYLTIRQILDEIKITENEDALSVLKERALSLALSYNFVTELTSLIVVESNPSPNSPGNFTIGDNTGTNPESEDGGFIPPGPAAPPALPAPADVPLPPPSGGGGAGGANPQDNLSFSSSQSPKLYLGYILVLAALMSCFHL